MKKLVLGLLVLIGCGKTQTNSNSQTVEQPGLQRIAQFMQTGLEENTPIVFNNQVVDLAFEHGVNSDYSSNDSLNTFTLFGMSGSEQSQQPSPNHSLGSVMEINGTYYITDSLDDSDPNSSFTPPINTVQLTSTTDLINFTPWQTIITQPANLSIANTSLAKTDNGYVIAYDTENAGYPNWEWSIRFYTSPDMVNWTQAGINFQGDASNYASAPSIRYINGMYYLFYTHELPAVTTVACDTRIARSVDLVNWEYQENPNSVVYPQSNDGTCASDMDLIEFNRQTYVTYAFGDQDGNPAHPSGIRAAVFNGTMQQFVSQFFN